MCVVGALCALAVNATPARADVVLDWNATMISVLTGPPFPASRFAAITQLAVFEAVNAITGDYTPYLGTITGPAGASPDAAAAAAAHRVLRTYFPGQAAALDAAYAASLSGIADGPAKVDGVAIGEAAAAAMISLRSNDGSTPSASYLPTTTDPGQWQLTAGCGVAGGAFLHWGGVTPFALQSAGQFRPGPPPSLTSGEYRKDFNEVLASGGIDSGVRPPDRTDVAFFYARLSPVTWANSAARQVAAANGGSLSENARALALLNMALSDAAVATFEAKYFYTFWRPETAIHRADEDGNDKTNADRGFVPLVSAPCFPGYPSNHATVSYAAREVLERLYGPSGHSISLSTTQLPGVTLTYSAFKRITDDVDDARVFGGIHFRFDQESGGKLGTSVGAYVVKTYLRQIPGR
ncbi:MAG: vanadium-dependent haloperoxidase, partial [Vicinamibacterales bacterium]